MDKVPAYRRTPPRDLRAVQGHDGSCFGRHVLQNRLSSAELTTGAQNDLEKVTQIARRMITEFGMSQKLGPRTFGKREELVFLGKEIHEQRNYSDKFAEEIDEEVEQLVKDAFSKALEIMQANVGRLKLIADFLIEKETIDEFTFEELLNKQLPKLEPDPETATAS